jgi:hypothetical protein
MFPPFVILSFRGGVGASPESRDSQVRNCAP